jgi:tetratricopeptide (TPR) repeat protein
MSPQQRRQRTLEALTTQTVALAEQTPLLMIFEDVHWIDPTSLEAVGRGIDRIKAVGVLLIITYRPEFEPLWIGRPYVTTLTIRQLAEREIASMIDRVVGNKMLAPNIRQDIIERTDGIPLFVEEMAKAVLEAESEGEARHAASAVSSSAIGVPASLHASLMTRLDRLGPAKEVAQIGAAIGREFSHALLAAVVRKPEAELGSALDRLIEAGLLFRQGVPPHASYLFKHALVQDAAYGTLLREPRRALHARIADTIESRFADIAETQPELLARHCTEAGLIEKAAGLWGKAGQRSLARSALVEAAEQLSRAVDQIASLPGTPALRREQIKADVALINPLLYLKGFAAPETKAAVERARSHIAQAEALGETLEDPLLLFSVLWSVWASNYMASRGAIVRNLASQFMTLAKEQGATVPLMIGHRTMAISLAFTGDIAESRAHFDNAIALYNPAAHRPLATRFGQDAAVVAMSYRSHAVWYLGYPAAAQADAKQALSDAREIGQATMMFALSLTAATHIFVGNYTTANEQLKELLSLADEKATLMWKGYGMASLGCLCAQTNKASQAVQIITSALAVARSVGAAILMPWNLSNLARAHAELGEFDDALRCIAEAILPSREARRGGWSRRSIASPEKSRLGRRNAMERKLARISGVRLKLPASKKQNHGNFAPR